jgi:hypothetical protein
LKRAGAWERAPPSKAREIEVKKLVASRRKGKKLTQKPLPQVLNLSKKGPNQPDIVKVIAALRNGK